MQRSTIGYALFALFVVAGMTIPAAAMSSGDGVAAIDANAQNDDQTGAQSVNVTVGQQLSTILYVSSGEIQTDFENTAFEVSVEGAGDDAGAEAIEDRAEELLERAEAISENYVDATQAYESGAISASEYAQRLARLNARATNLLGSYEQLQRHARNVSSLELRVAGLNESALRAAIENVSNVSGAGPAALLNQFIGDEQGEIELETDDGLSITIESDDGELTREIERAGDATRNVTVNRSVALEAARDALSTPENGTWNLTESTIDRDDGTYEFTFVLQGTADRTGEAEIGVDGSSGAVVSLEEEIEPRGDEDEGEADEHDEIDEETDDETEADEVFRKLNVHASLGNDTVTVSVVYDGSAVANATVYVNDRAVGTTNANGTVTFSIESNSTTELDLEVVKGAFEAELEYTVQNGSLTLTEDVHEGDGDKAEDDDEVEDEDEEAESATEPGEHEAAERGDGDDDENGSDDEADATNGTAQSTADDDRSESAAADETEPTQAH